MPAQAAHAPTARAPTAPVPAVIAPLTTARVTPVRVANVRAGRELLLAAVAMVRSERRRAQQGSVVACRPGRASNPPGDGRRQAFEAY